MNIIETDQGESMTVGTAPLRSVARTKFLIIIGVLLTLTVAIPSTAITPVRVGTSARVDHVELEVHEATGNLFGVVRYTIPSPLESLVETYGWAVLISSDGGASWTETFSQSRPVQIEFLSAAVVRDYLYVVSQEAGAASGLVDIRRFAVSNGASDPDFGFFTVVNVGSGQLQDLVLSGNTDSSDGALYLMLIDRSGNLRFFFAWDFSFDDGGTADDWNEISTGVTDADWRLDASLNVGDSPYFLFVSYVDSSGQLCVWRLSQAANNSIILTTEASSNSEIRIAANQNAVLIVYLRDDPLNRDIRYHWTQDAGSTWSWGTLAEDIGDGVTYMAPTVTGRWDRGFVAVHHKMGPGGSAIFSARRPAQANRWLASSSTTGIGLRTGTRTDVQPLVGNGWGVLFISDMGDPQAVYFMNLPLIFADGFASGNSVLWSSSTD